MLVDSNEYYPADLSFARTQDISKITEDVETSEDAAEEAEEEEETVTSGNKKDGKKKQKRAPNKLVYGI